MTDLAATLVLVVVAGAFAQIVARVLRMPAIFFLLSLGVLLGRGGVDWVRPELLRDVLPSLVQILVAIVVFEGSLSLRIANYRAASTLIRRLVTLGALMTWAGGALVCLLLLEWEWQSALLFGAIVVVSGPTVVQPILKRVRLKMPVHASLKWESILSDPVGVVLAVLAFDIVLLWVGAERTPARLAADLAVRTVVGVAVGLAGGLVLERSLPHLHRWIERDEEITNFAVLGAALAIFQVSQALSSDSGLIAVVTAGIFLGRTNLEMLSGVRLFKGQITVMAVSFLFVMLAADMDLTAVSRMGWRGPAVVLTCAWIIRPVVVWLCASGSDLSWREKLYIAWIGPRGIVAAAIVSLIAIRLEQAVPELPQRPLESLVFLYIFLTVAIAGLTAGPAARLLNTLSEDDRGVVIIGANPLAIVIGQGLNSLDVPVRLIDTQQYNCSRAAAQGLPAICASGSDADVLEGLGLDRFGALLAATPNSAINALACQTGRRLFGGSRAAQLCSDPSRLAITAPQPLEGMPLVLKGLTLNQAIAQVDAGRLRWGRIESDKAEAVESIPLFVVQGGSVSFWSDSTGMPSKDQAIYGLVL
jgi:NhaP-type Na+/H+ or K+/H+ antiporter